jgi:hypothetical protein
VFSGTIEEKLSIDVGKMVAGIYLVEGKSHAGGVREVQTIAVQ